MTLDPLPVILACAAATFATRVGGHLLLSRVERLHYRLDAALHAVPTAVMSALVVPAALDHGPAEALALLVAAAVAARASLLPGIGAGLAALIALRQLLG